MIRYYFLFLCLTAFSDHALSLTQKSRNGMISGGNQAAPNEFPWMVYVQAVTSRTNEAKNRSCAGSLISNQHVVTFANCLRAKPEYINILLGAHDLRLSSEPYRLTRRSDEYFFADAENEFSNPELAIIKFAKPVVFSPQIQPIDLPSINERFQPGTKVTLVGWGSSSNNANDVFRKSLEKVEVALKSEDVCERSPEDRYFCTSGAGGKGTCRDDGGPVCYYERSDKKWKLLGVIRNVAPCGKGGTSKHVRIQPYVPWIINITGMTASSTSTSYCSKSISFLGLLFLFTL